MDSIDIFRLIIERGFNGGDLTIADEVCSPDLLEHEYLVPNHLRGPDILKHQITSARQEMEGLQLTIEDHVANGDKLWVRMSGTG